MRRLTLAAWMAVTVTGALAGAVQLQAQTQPGPDRAGLARLMEGYRRPQDVPAPADNRITAPRADLGRALFFDPRLSGSGAISCGTCHNPSLGWQDGQALGVGHGGGRLGRHTPTILNAAWVEPLFWDGRAGTLEEQAKGPLAAPGEMNMPHADVVKTVAAMPGYQTLFAAAYPGERVSIDTVAKAIATYERTVVSGEAPFDRWVAGDAAAIPEAAKRGFVLYNTKAKCAACHAGWRMTDDGFHDIGLPDADTGRGRLFPASKLLPHTFKTPTLRNIAERAPYMHDGSVATLEAIVDHYDNGFVRRASLATEMTPLGLTPQEKADLVAFLRTLSSRDDAVAAPILPH